MYSNSTASAVAAAAAARGASAISSLAGMSSTSMIGSIGLPNTSLRCVELVEQLRAEIEIVARDTTILKAQRDELERKRM